MIFVHARSSQDDRERCSECGQVLIPDPPAWQIALSIVATFLLAACFIGAMLFVLLTLILWLGEGHAFTDPTLDHSIQRTLLDCLIQNFKWLWGLLRYRLI